MQTAKYFLLLLFYFIPLLHIFGQGKLIRFLHIAPNSNSPTLHEFQWEDKRLTRQSSKITSEQVNANSNVDGFTFVKNFEYDNKDQVLFEKFGLVSIEHKYLNGLLDSSTHSVLSDYDFSRRYSYDFQSKTIVENYYNHQKLETKFIYQYGDHGNLQSLYRMDLRTESGVRERTNRFRIAEYSSVKNPFSLSDEEVNFPFFSFGESWQMTTLRGSIPLEFLLYSRELPTLVYESVSKNEYKFTYDLDKDAYPQKVYVSVNGKEAFLYLKIMYFDFHR